MVLEKTLESPLDCKEIQPVHSKGALGVLWKEWCWSWNSSTLATSCEELTHRKRLGCWEGLGAGGEGDDRGRDGWMASPTRWMWVWVNSRSWWWTGKPGVLQFMGSQRVGHDWATELNWSDLALCFAAGLPYMTGMEQTPNMGLTCSSCSANTCSGMDVLGIDFTNSELSVSWQQLLSRCSFLRPIRASRVNSASAWASPGSEGLGVVHHPRIRYSVRKAPSPTHWWAKCCSGFSLEGLRVPHQGTGRRSRPRLAHLKTN